MTKIMIHPGLAGKPIVAEVEQHDGEYIAQLKMQGGFDLYGVGSTLGEARQDLILNIQLSYELSKEREATLGPKLRQEFRFLQGIFDPTFSNVVQKRNKIK